jgi:hypothetical protein
VRRCVDEGRTIVDEAGGRSALVGLRNLDASLLRRFHETALDAVEVLAEVHDLLPQSLDVARDDLHLHRHRTKKFHQFLY